jgi:hypothetical protein
MGRSFRISFSISPKKMAAVGRATVQKFIPFQSISARVAAQTYPTTRPKTSGHTQPQQAREV